MEKIILASGSQRRKEILANLSIPFEIVPPEVDEAAYAGLPSKTQVMLLARDKALNVRERLSAGASTGSAAARVPADAQNTSAARSPAALWIVGFDTLVELKGRILGKPSDREEARAMLVALSGASHLVHTGTALISPGGISPDVRKTTSKVWFKKLADKEIEYYLNTGEWEGAAGAYRIQEKGGFFAHRISGSYSNIVGLPISTFYAMLIEAKYNFS